MRFLRDFILKLKDLIGTQGQGCLPGWVSKRYGFCILNEELCIQNEELCIKT